MTAHGRNARRPLIVGVTGHRNLDAHDARLMHLVMRELKKVVRRHGDAPLLVLSGLAEGADRLVVDAAQKLGGRFVAVLPFPGTLYEQDFSGSASRAEYASLCGTATRVIPAPLMDTRRAVMEQGEPRNRQYAWSGAYIAKRAQTLIAIWDGELARGTGGTAEVVAWYLADKTPPAFRISQAPRLSGCKGVAPELIHIDPVTLKVRRIARQKPSARR